MHCYVVHDPMFVFFLTSGVDEEYQVLGKVDQDVLLNEMLFVC